ncbi:MAG: hypothetical protein K0Q87_2620 [Neobacillus sp.]|jgi:uncharacterized membrane protein YkvA (DUF1232 family)|nr:hypothetical protein [Neobacillus sp.]
MFRSNEDLEKEQEKYADKAKDYIDNQEKTDGLLKKALLKAKNNKGSLGEAWEKLQLLVDLVKAYSKGEYRQVTKSTIITVIGAILYFVSPVDLVPDFIVGLGILDDAAVIGFTLKKISAELDAFNKWKKTGQIITSPLK